MSNQDAVKAAATRMCEHFGTKGIKMKHTQMLEALAIGFGLDNWRELKAVIDAPRAKQEKKPVVPPLGEWQTWIVDAIYVDNDQQYGDRYSGRTPLEAAINAKMERLTDFGNEINIVEVSDVSGECRLSPSYVTEIQLCQNVEALRALARAVQAIEGELSGQALLAREWLYEVLEGELEEVEPDPWGKPEPETFRKLTDYYDLGDVKNVSTEPAVIGHEGTPTELLIVLCDLLTESHGGVVEFERKHEGVGKKLYQVHAMCEYFGELVNSWLAGYEVESLSA